MLLLRDLLPKKNAVLPTLGYETDNLRLSAVEEQVYFFYKSAVNQKYYRIFVKIF